MNAQLVTLAIEEVPELIALIKARFSKANPDEPPPSSEQVVAAYKTAMQSSLALDDQWLAAHPEDTPPAPVVEAAPEAAASTEPAPSTSGG